MGTSTFAAAYVTQRAWMLNRLGVVALILMTTATAQQQQRQIANQNDAADDLDNLNRVAHFMNGAPATLPKGANQALAHNNQLMATRERKDKPLLESIVATYEKIATNGSEVRLVCPHVVNPENTTESFVSASRNSHDHQHARKQNQQPQPAHGSALNPRPRAGLGGPLSATNYDGHEQIRWFRNHVPLQEGGGSIIVRSVYKGRGRTGRQTRLQADAANPMLKHQPPPPPPPRDNGATMNFPSIKPRQPLIVSSIGVSGKSNWTGRLVLDERENGNNERLSPAASDDDGEPDGDEGDIGVGRDERESIRRRFDNVPNANEFFRGESQFEEAEWARQRKLPARTDGIHQEQLDSFRHGRGQDGARDWFINEFGELVLPRVNPSLSGSYTCLHGGQQSEVLLDVLPDGRASLIESAPTGGQSVRFEADETPRTRATSGVATSAGARQASIDSNPAGQALASPEVLSAIPDAGQLAPAPAMAPDGRPTDERPRTEAEGARLAERRSRAQRGADFRRTSSNIQRNSLQPMDNQVGRDSAGIESTRTSGRRLKRLSAKITTPTTTTTTITTTTTTSTTTGTPVKTQQDKNLIAQEWPATKPVSPLGTPTASGDNKNSKTIQKNQAPQMGAGENLNMSYFRTSPDTADRLSSKWAHLDPISERPQNQQARPHLVEAEIVSGRDLETIPGFMFTRQQFYCPLMKQRDLARALANQINLLIGNLCRPSENDAGRRGLDENHKYRSCAKLVDLVVIQLFGFDDRGRPSDISCNDRNGAALRTELNPARPDCLDEERANSIGEVVWYKDGTKLDFDPNGRGLDKKLNVKLIDFIDQFESPPHGARDGASIDLEQSNNRPEEISSSSSLREPRMTERPTRERRAGRPPCPARGLILEIDGIRRINAGRYTCAFELNNSKLLTRLGALKRLQPAHKLAAIEMANSPGQAEHMAGKDDKSKRCDASEAALGASEQAARPKPEPSSAPDRGGQIEATQLNSDAPGSGPDSSAKNVGFIHNELQADIDVYNAPIGRPDASLAGARDPPNESMPQKHLLIENNSPMANNEIISENSAPSSFVSKSIEILESTLNNASSMSNEAWSFLEQAINRARPVVGLQSFILIINERPANLCSLWSTIGEANKAYSRRKLTDFRRLKLGLMKQAGATINADDGGQQQQNRPGRRYRGGRGRRHTRERRESLNGPNGGRHRADEHHQQRRQHIAPSDCEHNAGDNDRHHDGAGGIDGKLVASLSWLNGVGVADGESAKLARVTGRHRDDTEHARRPGASESSGQQNSIVPSGSLDAGCADRDGAPGWNDNNNNGRQIGEVRQLERVTKTDGVRHRRPTVWPNGSLIGANKPAAAKRAPPADAWSGARPANGPFRTASRTNNGGAQSAGIVQNPALGEHSQGGAEQEEEAEGAKKNEEGEAGDGDVGGPGNVAIPFNYANERNLNPGQEAARARGSFSKRSEPASKRAQTFAESLDLHLNTLDPAGLEARASYKTRAKTSMAARTVVVDDGTAAMFDEPHMDETQPAAAVTAASQRSNTGTARGPSGESLAGSGSLSYASANGIGGDADADADDHGDEDGRHEDETSTTQEERPRRGPNWALNRVVLIDDLVGGRRVNSLAKNVIDGNLEPPRAGDGGGGHQDDSTGEPDEAPNEVSNRMATTRVAEVAPASSGRPGKLFDSRAGGQTNSSSSPSSEFPLRQQAATVGPSDDGDGDRISTPEFVTEKSNIRMRERARRRRGRKFNNIVTVRGPTAWSGAVPLAVKRSSEWEGDGRDGHHDDGNFINSPFVHDGRRTTVPAPPRPYSGRLILDDQSDSGHEHIVSRNGATDAPSMRAGRRPLSIGHAGSLHTGQWRARGQSRQPYDWGLGGGHKLQLSGSEQARRFSRSDKSARSGQQDGGSVTSDPLRRHRRLTSAAAAAAAAAGDQAEEEIPSASTQSPAATTPPSGPVRAPSVSGGHQYGTTGANDGFDNHDSDTSLLSTSTTDNPLDNAPLQARPIATSPDNQNSPSRTVASNGRVSGLTSSDVSSSISLDGSIAAAAAAAATGAAINPTVDDVDSIKQPAIGVTSADDENLLWTVGQYLYMHVRAFAASSMYGVQVDVEWSNENERPTGINRNATMGMRNELGTGQDLHGSNFNVSQSVDESGVGVAAAGGEGPVTPIATIELVSGQDLHLHCTAQALGRLPEVKWYRRVQRIPEHVPPSLRQQLARTVSGDLFWPVASLDFLDDGDGDDDDDDDDEVKTEESQYKRNDEFICSQSTTIFDNLLNQTFTVVNSLKLSERTDEKTSNNLANLDTRQMMMESFKDRRSPVLYLCLVKADVRHEFAALGVRFRSAAASKLPSELSQRLRARSMPEFAKRTETAELPSDLQRAARPDISDLRFRLEGQNFNFLRQNQLVVPLEDIWIPISKNGTHFAADDEYLREIYAGTRYPINPLVLSLMIFSLSSLLVALVYFTVRSYRALVSLQAEDDVDDLGNRRHSFEDHENESSPESIRPAISYCEFDMRKHAISHRLKRLDDVEDDAPVDDGDGIQETITKQSSLTYRTKVSSTTKVGADVIPGIESQGPLYEAHFHDPDASLICDQMPASLLSDMLSTDIKNGLEYTLDDGFGVSKACCSGGGQSQVLIMDQTTSWADYDQGTISTVVGHSNKLSPRQ